MTAPAKASACARSAWRRGRRRGRRLDLRRRLVVRERRDGQRGGEHGRNCDAERLPSHCRFLRLVDAAEPIARPHRRWSRDVRPASDEGQMRVRPFSRGIPTSWSSGSTRSRSSTRSTDARARPAAARPARGDRARRPARARRLRRRRAPPARLRRLGARGRPRRRRRAHDAHPADERGERHQLGRPGPRLPGVRDARPALRRARRDHGRARLVHRVVPALRLRPRTTTTAVRGEARLLLGSATRRVTLAGRTARRSRPASIPRPLQQPLPVWVAVGGSPESAARAGHARPADGARDHRRDARAVRALRRDPPRGGAPRPATTRCRALSINSHGFVADTSQAGGRRSPSRPLKRRWTGSAASAAGRR